MNTSVDTTPWRKAGGKRGAREKAPDSAWAWRMSRLTRDGTAEPVSRDQILRRERGQGKLNFSPVQLTTSRIEDQSAECDDQQKQQQQQQNTLCLCHVRTVVVLCNMLVLKK